MTRRILAYQTPAQLFRSDSVMQKEYADCLHVTATTSLRRGIGETIRDNSSFLKAPVITFNELFSEMAGTSWYSQTAQLKQFLSLTTAVRELWESGRNISKHNLQAVSRDQMTLLKTIRTLTELEITFEDFQRNCAGNLTDDENILLKIWRHTKDRFTDDYSEMSALFAGKKDLFKEMERVLLLWGSKMMDSKNKSKRSACNLYPDKWKDIIHRSIEKRKLVLHGFYFITPIQEKIFKLLEKEYELLFLNLYDERFPSTFETVTSFLGTDINEVVQVVPDDASINPVASRLIESLEGYSYTSFESEATIYTDLAHFAEVEKYRLEELDKRPELSDYRTEHLITPRAEELKKELTAIGFIPYEYESLTDHPAGRYLYRLHMLKQEITDVSSGDIITTYEVTPEAVLDCFLSGCVIANGVNMRGYVKQFEQIMPFCKNITQFDDWIKNLEELKEIKREWEDRVHEINPVHTTDDLHKFHSLPMRQLSYFYVSVDDIDAITEGIKSLRIIHDRLFGSWNKQVNIKTHLDQIKDYALQDAPDYFDEEEKKAVEAILSAISEINDDDTEFMLKDLANGLAFYLNNALKELESEDQGFKEVNSLLNADGAPFYIYRKFHLAFVDEKALPISQEFNLWPISRQVLKTISTEFKELQLIEKRENMSRSISRYLLYSLLHSADEIRFSYAENLPFQTDLKPSLYMKLLELNFCSPKKHSPQISKGMNDKIELSGTISDRTNWTKTMKKEAEVCPRRATFSFELNTHTRFSNDFHLRFLYSKFLTYFNVASPVKVKGDIATIIDKWFPQWNETKKSIINTESSSYRAQTCKMDNTIGGVPYSSAISEFSLIPNGKAKSKSNQMLSVNKRNSYEAKPGEHCKYCPYIDICREAEYSIDYEENRGN
ncbi:hypothetical protein [Virgibacillus sp. MG-45]|uniref:hypothetical protein n=1 Tax=Virgibacillus sp. MG-45 TaxID=3102791 RepID=UPI002ED96976